MTNEQALELRLADALRKTLKREVDKLNSEYVPAKELAGKARLLLG